jgi:flagellar biosynthesis anti-sigma factor FlgM
VKIEQLNGISNTEQARAANRPGAQRTNGTESSLTAAAGNSKSPSDQVYISPRAETVSRLVARVRTLPDIRQERVESLRAMTTTGAYRPSASDIADAIIGGEGVSQK